MSLAVFADAHAELIATFGGPATYAPVAGGSIPLQAMLDRHTAEVGDFGQTVAYRPSISVLTSAVPLVTRGDVITFDAEDTESWQVVRIADADDMVTRLWVEPA